MDRAGSTCDEIARRPSVTVDTVKKHFGPIPAKTGRANRAQFVGYWLTGR